jgi:N-acetylglucosaminyl-diphospho-decaprenol L-rhamnosyltransferase
MKLSIVIICWNDWKVIENCLRSIQDGTHKSSYEIIVSDNGSTDGSVEKIREHFPRVRIVENRANLGFARGNNAGIREAQGDYVLILNPDTIVHEGSLDRWLDFADAHPEAGAFGCLVQNPDGSYQRSARPFPTIWRFAFAALGLHFLGSLLRQPVTDEYEGWEGNTQRAIDWQSGCCVLFRGELLRSLGGFDEQFFYQFEEVDLCRRARNTGAQILFTPTASITHLGGQSVSRFPVRFALEVCRNGYRYFYKHFGARGAKRYRKVILLRLRVRKFLYGLENLLRPSDRLKSRLETYNASLQWNARIDPIKFVLQGVEGPTDQPLRTADHLKVN